MEFWIDMGFAVLLRLLKDRRERAKYISAFAKVYNAIGETFNPNHTHWEPQTLKEVS